MIPSRSMAAFAATALASGLALAAAQTPSASVFTADQADLGQSTYQANCAGCHMVASADDCEAPPATRSAWAATLSSRTATC